MSIDIDGDQMPPVQDMSILGTHVSLHNMGQTAVQHRMRKSWEAFFMIQLLLRHCKSAGAARTHMFRAVLTSTAHWGVETVPLAQTMSRSLDVNMTSTVCIVLL